MVYDFHPLESVADLDNTSYRPCGGTALLDALGTMINNVGEKLSAMSEEDRPSKVLFLVITDGEENSSVVFSKEKIKEMVQHQKDVYKREFVFMGANIDSMGEGMSMGFSQQNTMDYTASPVGTRSLYKDISKSTTRYRNNGASNSGGFFGKSK